MADTNFQPGTVIASSWLRDANTSVYNILAAVAGINTVTGNGPSTVTALARGQRFFFTPAADNTGPATLNVSGLGARPLRKQGAIDLVAGDLVAGSTCIVFFDGAQYQVLNPQGPLSGTDTYIATAGTSIAYTLAIQGSFSRFVGNAIKLVFNVANTSTTPTLDVDGTGPAAIKLFSVDGTKIDPTIGTFGANTTATAVWDGTNWMLTPDSVPGRLINVQTFLAGGTYTPTPGTTSIIAEVVGGGGGGGGAVSSGAGAQSVGGGGSSGAYTRGRFTTGFSGAAVTVGAGGLGVVGAAGTAGGTSSLGALITAPGGNFGSPSGTAATVFCIGGGPASAGTGGNIIASSGNAGTSNISAFAAGAAVSGAGGVGPYGGSAVASITASALTGSVANSNTGAGGAGGAVHAFATNVAGGAGGSGRVTIYEFS